VCTAVLIALAAVGAWSARISPAFTMEMVAADPSGGGDATLSPDGRRIVTTSTRTGNVDLWMYDISARRWMQLTDDAAEDFEARWSPDGRQLAFTSTRGGQKDIWTLDLGSGSTRRLTDDANEDEYPAWSPDGGWIVYTGGPWNARDIFIVPARGGARRKLTRESGRVGACMFESSGTTLVCHRYDLGSGDLIRLWVDDGEIAPLTIGAPWDYKPAPSGDGKWIAFSRSIENPSGVWVMPAAGGAPRPLVTGTHDHRWPTWSADSTRLLYHRLVNEGEAIGLLDRATRQLRIIPSDLPPLQASLSPDGARLAYCAQAPDQKTVRIVDLSSGRTTNVDAGGFEACYPRWSPVGDRLARVVRAADRWEIAVATGDGSLVHLLTSGKPALRGMDGPVDWSPDGRRILFHADTEPFDARLYVISPETRVVTPVTDTGFYDESPSFTPDGQHVLFTSTRGGNWSWGFFELASRTGRVRPLAPPDWVEKNYLRAGLDGTLVWSAVDRYGREHLYERAPGDMVKQVLEAGDGARWPSYSRDGRQLVFTRVRRRVEYCLVNHPTGRGSPIFAPAQPLPAESPPQRRTNPHAPASPNDRQRSPQDLHRR
jgi:TolB protein